MKKYGFYRVVIDNGDDEESTGIYYSPDGKTFLWFNNLDEGYLSNYAEGNVGRLENALQEGYTVISAEYLGD